MTNKYYGLYQGIVTNIQDPEKRGRIKVKCPSVLGGETESAWCDPLVPVAYDNGGDFCIPAKDEAVWLQFIEGDVNKPVWLGGWWQKNMTPLGDNYSKANKVRIINYADCTITMQDDTITINVGGGNGDLVIADNKVTVKGDLVVGGSIKAGSVSADSVASSGSISASSITANGSVTAGSVTASGSVSANSVSAGGVSLSQHKHSGVTAGGDSTGSPM